MRAIVGPSMLPPLRITPTRPETFTAPESSAAMLGTKRARTRFDLSFVPYAAKYRTVTSRNPRLAQFVTPCCSARLSICAACMGGLPGSCGFDQSNCARHAKNCRLSHTEDGKRPDHLHHAVTSKLADLARHCAAQKKEIDKAVDKTIKEYGETLRLLANEDQK